ncbi:histidine phosphatase family protein [Mycobacterium sp.]|uniref:histidine phosphatase family protein n=1 Tax=Mycobacterium sp. TaxID=1785 RepID=UPI00122BFD54|nr:histidine phosphatase family protein [Mycobacterium sp.]TAM64440.1 MAG: histidine phosphatase family protein [Mycobacterium sp.]
MQPLLIRHALPVPSANGGGADPGLSELGLRMAERLPDALRRHHVSRIVSSPQLRARQTAQPLAGSLDLAVEVDERLAEYDYGLAEYVPVEQMRAEDPLQFARLVSGQLPDGVDADAFKARVTAAADHLISTAGRHARVAVFGHGGVINVLLQRALGTPRLFPCAMDYVSVSHLRYSAGNEPTVLGVNNIEHVWDLLPRLNKIPPEGKAVDSPRSSNVRLA